MNSKVDDYLSEVPKWKSELEKLRRIILDCGLTEELKWGVPCYTFEKTNILGINCLKECCALSFFKGVLLSDPGGILLQPGENTQAGRWIKFTSVREIAGMEVLLKEYIREAIEVEIAGLKVVYKELSEFPIPEELQSKMAKTPALKAAFEALTPGRQRAYILHFSAPKQSKTREARIEKCMPQILCGKGLNDCTCGHSKRLPSCDGSHKFLR